MGIRDRLLTNPDIRLLDEPTNHLDLNSIAWLENYLLNYHGAVLIVSHDRYFLNRVVTKVIEIEQGELTCYLGNYSDYAAKKQQIREARLKEYLNQQQEIRHQEAVIEKLRSFNREKSIRRAESRVKMLDKMDRIEKPVEMDTEIHLTLEPAIILSLIHIFCQIASVCLLCDHQLFFIILIQDISHDLFQNIFHSHNS